MLKDVRHVPNLHLNLVSAVIVAQESQYYSLYKLQAKIEEHEMNVADHDSSLDLWHRRLGHISQKGLEVLVKGKHK